MEREKLKYIAIGGSIVFFLCLVVGLLDKYELLDEILDFLHIP
jgi:hypothetical protein